MQKLSVIQIAIAYFIVINIVTFFTYGMDKWKASHSKWRIPEATLLLLALIGGSVGALLGMKVWHHKTLHKKFRYGIPAIIMIQMALLALSSCGTNQRTAIMKPETETNTLEHSPSTLIVMYDAETGKAPLLKAAKDYGAEIIYDYNMISGMALRKPDDKSLEETMEFFKKVEGVVSVEYDHVMRLTDPVNTK